MKNMLKNSLMLLTLFSVASCNQNSGQVGYNKTATTADEEGDLTLSWTGDSTASSYEIYFGKTETTVTQQVYTATQFDKAAPSADLVVAELSLKSGDKACFSVVAVNAAGKSSPSTVACGTVP